MANFEFTNTIFTKLIKRIKNIDKKQWSFIILLVVFITVFISAYYSSIFNTTKAEKIIMYHINKTEDVTNNDKLLQPEKAIKTDNDQNTVHSFDNETILQQEADISETEFTEQLYTDQEPAEKNIALEELDTEVSEKTTLRDSKPEKTSVVDIEKFEIKSLDSENAVEVSFSLLNKTEDNSPVSGYVFVFATNQADKQNVYALWPQTEHVAGVPVDYTDGSQFMMRYYLSKKGEILYPGNEEEFDHFEIIVYSEDGELILKKEVAIE